MKTCPICKARCFDDMEVCYGCMHRFAEDEAFAMPVEDATPVADMPLRPAAAHGAPAPVPAAPPEPDAADARPRATRREAPRVFGAREDDAFEDVPAYADAETLRIPVPALSDDARGMPRLELMAGPLAVAPLGGGWRLVVSIERG